MYVIFLVLVCCVCDVWGVFLGAMDGPVRFLYCTWCVPGFVFGFVCVCVCVFCKGGDERVRNGQSKPARNTSQNNGGGHGGFLFFFLSFPWKKVLTLAFVLPEWYFFHSNIFSNMPHLSSSS